MKQDFVVVAEHAMPTSLFGSNMKTNISPLAVSNCKNRMIATQVLAAGTLRSCRRAAGDSQGQRGIQPQSWVSPNENCLLASCQGRCSEGAVWEWDLSMSRFQTQNHYINLANRDRFESAFDSKEVELFHDLLSEPLFDQLRTKQQLGYVASKLQGVAGSKLLMFGDFWRWWCETLGGAHDSTSDCIS